MLLTPHDHDPAMRFESLVRHAFDCSKMADPWGYAGQEVYNNFVPTPNLRGKRALSTTLIKLALDSKDALREGFIELEEAVWKAETQQEIITVIDKAIAIIEDTE